MGTEKMSQFSIRHNQSYRNILKCIFGMICLGCSQENNNLTLDHIVPLSKGGRHCLANCQLLCSNCNSKKGNQLIDYRKEFPLGRYPYSKNTKYKCANLSCKCNKELKQYAERN